LTWLEIHGQSPELAEHWKTVTPEAALPTEHGHQVPAAEGGAEPPFRKRRRRRRRRRFTTTP
jgi:hypothetical protein